MIGPYRSLTKECLAPIFDARMSTHPAVSFVWLMEFTRVVVRSTASQALSVCEVRNLVCYTSPKVITRQLCVDGRS